MKRTPILLIVCVLLLLSFLLSACATRPAEPIIGETRVSVLSHNEEASGVSRSNKISLNPEKQIFLTNDGTVEYYICCEIEPETLPIIDVAPHVFTAQEAQQVAAALFGDAVYEEYINNEPLTTEDWRDCMARWKSYLNDGTLNDLFAGDKKQLQEIEIVINRFAELYESKLQESPKQVQRVKSDWTFHPDSYYGPLTDGTAESIRLFAHGDGPEYVYSVFNRTDDSFTVHMIAANASIFSKLSPNYIDALVWQYEQCKSTLPSHEQIESIESQVISVLNALDCGDWALSSCSTKPLARGTEEAYIVSIKAVQVLNGITPLQQIQLSNLRTPANGAQHFYYTEASFDFSPNGTLLNCNITCPVDVKDIVTEQANVLSEDDLLATVKESLIQRTAEDYLEYFFFEEDISDYTVRVYVDDIPYGLSRIELLNGHTYRYIPSVFIDGHIEIYDKKGELVRGSSPQEIWRFGAFNALDGSPIIYDSDNAQILRVDG